MTSLDCLDFHAHLRHNVHTVGKRESDAFLSRAEHVRLFVYVEVDAMDRRSRVFVLEYTFRRLIL